MNVIKKVFRVRTEMEIKYILCFVVFFSDGFSVSFDFCALYQLDCCACLLLFHLTFSLLYKRLYTTFDNKKRWQSQRKCQSLWHCQKQKVLHGLSRTLDWIEAPTMRCQCKVKKPIGTWKGTITIFGLAISNRPSNANK